MDRQRKLIEEGSERHGRGQGKQKGGRPLLSLTPTPVGVEARRCNKKPDLGKKKATKRRGPGLGSKKRRLKRPCKEGKHLISMKGKERVMEFQGMIRAVRNGPSMLKKGGGRSQSATEVTFSNTILPYNRERGPARGGDRFERNLRLREFTKCRGDEGRTPKGGPQPPDLLNCLM